MKIKKIQLCIWTAVLVLFYSGLFSSCQTQEKTHKKFYSPEEITELESRLALETKEEPKSGKKTSEGTFAVFEDRESQTGRMIHLSVVILHAEGPEVKPDPLFVFAGGPGADVTKYKAAYRNHWVRKHRDVVLVSQRGTGGDNCLDCPSASPEDDVQSYFEPLFRAETFKKCLEELQKEYDLTQYSTCLAADDTNEVRLALGYGQINITGTSYGTRMALIYMRRHPETIRTAMLNGVAPLAFKNPLFHAWGFQRAMDLLLDECSEDPECGSAFPNLRDEFDSILTRLEEKPAEVMVTHPKTHEQVSILLSREAFVEAMRTIMYSKNREVPLLIHEASKGNYKPFAQAGLFSEWTIRNLLATGMLLCVTCAEDLDRISEQEIIELAENTYMGSGRVRRQKAVCEFWPRSELPKDFGEPVSVDIPALILSGFLDPVTPPDWGEDAASHLPNSLHIVVPGAHGVGGECLEQIEKQFMETGSVEGLDTSCTDTLEVGEFKLKHDSEFKK
ncbi:MAG: alpha/beta fold hydrolase [Candidatus Aminicenantes bacterium]|nr:alpha/beta fold hydrolase [Candidatus Aminicenantes bacterium]